MLPGGCCTVHSCRLQGSQHQKKILSADVSQSVSTTSKRALMNCLHQTYSSGKGEVKESFLGKSVFVLLHACECQLSLVCVCVCVLFSFALNRLCLLVRAPLPPSLCIVTQAVWVTPLHQLPHSSQHTSTHRDAQAHTSTQRSDRPLSLNVNCGDHQLTTHK